MQASISKQTAAATQHIEKAERKILARITYYCPEPIWGTKVAQPTVKKAVRGVTVAAHPNFKFGTKVEIPALKNKMGDGKFTVQDRGPAVTRKAASHGKNYVFDVYCSSRAEMNRLAKVMPEYMYVTCM